MALEIIDLREFLASIPVYALRQILAYEYWMHEEYAKGYSTMRKTELVDAVCQRLDHQRIYEGVITWLKMWVSEGKYPPR